MALTNCIECGQEVSDKAESCPNCGAPSKSFKARVNEDIETYTVQVRAKRFKLQKLVSLFIVIVGFLILVSGDLSSDGKRELFWMSVIIIGAIWYLTNRIRIWWHHK